MEIISCIESLNNFYNQQGFDLVKDLPYLKTAHSDIMALWHKNLNNTKSVEVVIIGEAPLWGEKRSYIYNPETPNTQFFYRSDLEPLLGFTPKNKPEFLSCLAELGIVIIDVSPFALNNKDTQLTYNKLSNSDYLKLVDRCWEEHIGIILNKVQPFNPTFTFRYKRLRTIFGPLFEDRLGIKYINSIYQVGGGISRIKLLSYFESSDLNSSVPMDSQTRESRSQTSKAKSEKPMNLLKLHEAIAVVLLNKEDRTATIDEISTEIANRGLFNQKSGDIAPPGQIRLRTHPNTNTGKRYGHLFEYIEPNMVKLK